MATHFRLRDVDRGFARLLRQLRGRFAQRLAVGVLARRGDVPNEGSDVTVMAIAMVHEFGGGDVPERSFLRAWADERQAANLDRIRRVARAAYQNPGSEEKMLRVVGAEMVAEIRDRMRSGIDPALAPRTVIAKGDETPLVGGQLERAVAFEVRAAGAS